jgi:hypothetical protein
VPREGARAVVTSPDRPEVAVTYRAFLGYASKPELARETLHRSSTLISELGIKTRSWEDLATGGQLIISAVLAAIDESDVSIFDVSTLNPNVLYELGYAIGRADRIWLLLDKSDDEAKARWERFRLLSSILYRGWSTSDDIRTQYIIDQPHLQETTIYDQLIEPTLNNDPRGAAIFYVPMGVDTDAGNAVASRLTREVNQGIRLITADPTESSLSPLSWYAQKANESAATIVHFSAERRTLAHLRNARAALIAGLATGLERPVLMLAEEDYSAPIDYQDRLRHYQSSDEAYEYTDAWLTAAQIVPDERYRTRRLQLVTQLRGLSFGEHVAENESDSLSDYFMETAAFNQALKSRLMLFVGRKGAGKTANMLQAAAHLQENARNFVVVIKPASYDFSALLALLNDFPGEIKDYSIEGLWRFLLQSEIARTAIASIEARPSHVPYTEAELELLRFADEAPFDLRGEFAKRFEDAIGFLRASNITGERSVSAGRDLLNEALHAETIRRLRRLLGPVFSGRDRVAVLIDNLDKAWDRRVDLAPLSQLLLGLLGAVGRLSQDFEREDSWRQRIELSLVVFLRSDIYAYLQREAREPDKIPTQVLSWADRELLLRLIEERFLAIRPPGTVPDELWERFFCRNVKGIETRQYLLSRSLPRPRDMVYLCNGAVSAAVNSRHDVVTEDDIIAAEAGYSQFAYEALLVENGITVQQLDRVLLEFAGSDSVLPASAVRGYLRVAGIDEDTMDYVMDRLTAVSFLGVETGPNRFQYIEGESDSLKLDVLARKYCEQSRHEPRYSIHPAYRTYLEIQEL